ncbi:MAG: efflux RND transporter periplasmic adaptor subunit [Hylemonella sp.]
MKRSIKWVLALLVLSLLAVGIYRLASKRQGQGKVLPATQSAQSLVELANSDVMTIQAIELTLSQPVSGSIKALNSAFVKARVAGELQELTLREGERVQAGQLLARIDPTEMQARLRQSQQQSDAARAQADIAKRQLDDNRALVQQGFISNAALSNSENNLRAAQANLLAAQAAEDVARKALQDTELRAPIAGTVAQRLAQAGERVAVDTRVIEIVDLSRLELEASLSAAEAAQIRVGQSGSLEVEGLPDLVTARVVRISPSVQPGSRAVLVYLGLQDGMTQLRHGLFAQGQVVIGKSHGLAVPVSAVRTDRPAPYVQVVEQGQIANREVILGARGEAGGETMVLLQGIPENAQVVRGHVGILRAGTAVKFTAPGATGSGAR